jgi:hypothetical protein
VGTVVLLQMRKVSPIEKPDHAHVGAGALACPAERQLRRNRTQKVIFLRLLPILAGLAPGRAGEGACAYTIRAEMGVEALTAAA